MLIFQRDRQCFQYLLWAPALLVVTILFSAFYVAIAVQELQSSFSEIFLTIGLPALGGLLLSGTLVALGLRRIRRIRRTIDEGRRVEAVLTEVYYSLPWPLSKDLKAIFTMQFELDGQAHESTSTMVRRQGLLGFEPGMKVIAAVDPTEPKAAYITEFFLEPKQYQ